MVRKHWADLPVLCGCFPLAIRSLFIIYILLSSPYISLSFLLFCYFLKLDFWQWGYRVKGHKYLWNTLQNYFPKGLYYFSMSTVLYNETVFINALQAWSIIRIFSSNLRDVKYYPMQILKFIPLVTRQMSISYEFPLPTATHYTTPQISFSISILDPWSFLCWRVWLLCNTEPLTHVWPSQWYVRTVGSKVWWCIREWGLPKMLLEESRGRWWGPK